jgi:hypothetical protein
MIGKQVGRPSVNKTGTANKSRKRPISLYPLDFETAVRAAMQTGAPPKEGRRPPRKRKT